MDFKKRDVIKEAGEIKKFMDQKKRPPTTCNIQGNIISGYSIAYLMSLMINDKFKGETYPLANVRVYDPSKKLQDTINEKVMKDDYLVMVGNFVKFCRKYHRVPRFITTQKSQTKVSFELFLYCVVKIVCFFQSNKKFPNYCNFNKADVQNGKTPTSSSKNEGNKYISPNKNTGNCTNPYRSKPHPTKQGCNQMGQNTNYYCGVSALQKVLFKFGITKYTQDQLAKYAGTTTKGTDHKGLETALAKVSKDTGVKLSCKWYYLSDLGFEKLAKQICKSNVDAIIHLKYRMKYGHYEVIDEVDVDKKQLKILNSLGNKCGACFCGYVETRSFAIEKKYIDGVTQKSVMLITKG